MADGITERNNGKNVQAREETRANERYIRPAVDIIETEVGLTLIADIPGATKEGLDVNVEKGVLTISAPAARTMPGRQVIKEFETAPYYRQFSIPEVLDHEKAAADYANGLLTLKIPKVEAAKPRKIEIKVA
jgi:HSP20 family molecular chaperone IbpA